MSLLYCCTASWWRLRSTASRFSLPASSSISRWKLASALSCGYASLMESSLPMAPSNWLAVWILSARELAPSMAARALAMSSKTPFSWRGRPSPPSMWLEGGEKVGAARQLVLHLAPGGLDGLLLGNDAVVAARAAAGEDEDEEWSKLAHAHARTSEG